MDAALRKCFWSGADAVRIIGELGAAVSPAPVQTHFCKREGSGGTIVDPMSIAENHQRFFQRIQLDLYGASGFVLLMVGVGVTGGEKLRAGFGDSQIEHAAAQRKFFGGQLPQLRFGAQARGSPHIGQGQNGNAQMVLPLPREGAMKRAEAQRFYDFHCVCKASCGYQLAARLLLKNNPFFGLIDIRLCHNR